MKILVIMGNGFAALAAALTARRLHGIGNDGEDDKVKIIMISPNREQIMRFLLFRANPDKTVINIDHILNKQNISHQKGIVTHIDARNKKLRLDDGQIVMYDKLIVATGSIAKPSGIEDKNNLAFNLYDYDAAKRLEQHLTSLMSDKRSGPYRFAIVGTSCTAIEVACELGNKYGTNSALEITLYERENCIYPTASAELREIVLTELKRQNIKFHLNCKISKITPQGMIINEELHAADTVILATGLVGNSHIDGLPTDKNALGQIKISPECIVCEGVYAAGDIAYVPDTEDSGNSNVQMSAQRALLTGKIAGHNAMGELLYGDPTEDGEPTFAYAQYLNPILSTILDMGPEFGISAQGRVEQKVIATGPLGALIKELFCQTMSPLRYNTSRKRLREITNPANLLPLAPYFAFNNPATSRIYYHLPARVIPAPDLQIMSPSTWLQAAPVTTDRMREISVLIFCQLLQINSAPSFEIMIKKIITLMYFLRYYNFNHPPAPHIISELKKIWELHSKLLRYLSTLTRSKSEASALFLCQTRLSTLKLIIPPGYEYAGLPDREKPDYLLRLYKRLKVHYRTIDTREPRYLKEAITAHLQKAGNVFYLSETEKFRYRIIMLYGKLYRCLHPGLGYTQYVAHGYYDTSAVSTRDLGDHTEICVTDIFGRVFAGPKVDNMLQHSSYASGLPVFFAGGWVVENGAIKTIFQSSGHYKTTLQQLYNFLFFLQDQGINIRNITVKRLATVTPTFITTTAYEFIALYQENKHSLKKNTIILPPPTTAALSYISLVKILAATNPMHQRQLEEPPRTQNSKKPLLFIGGCCIFLAALFSGRWFTQKFSDTSGISTTLKDMRPPQL